MDKSRIGALLRKYWYIIPIAAVVLAAAGHMLSHSDKNPEELLRKYGYLVILIWTFFEGETIVIAAGALSARLDLDPWLIVLFAFTGSFISDQLMFSLGKYKGEAVLGYFPGMAKKMDTVARLLKKYDAALILSFRFVYGVRNITPILLGVSQVSHLKFFTLNSIGAAIWAISFTMGGYYLREAFLTVARQAGGIAACALAGIIILAGILIFWRNSRSKNKPL